MTHEDYMREALFLAREAAAQGEIPVGCVIADAEGRIIARGANTRERERSALGHAELAAIDEACRSLSDWRLSGCTLYVTLEPCPMCTGAIINARIPTVVFGARGKTSALAEALSTYSPSATGISPQFTAECWAMSVPRL